MADSKLSAISLGSVCSQYYGIDASNVSKRFVDEQIYNVKNYGAVASGAVDDSAAIQSCVNAAAAAGSSIVFFPPGNYRVDSAISFNSNSDARLKLIGSGQNRSIIYTNNNIWIFKGTNVQGEGGGWPIASIEDLGFSNRYASGADLTSSETANGCLYLIAGNCDIQRCVFSCDTSGICVYSTGNPTISNSTAISGYNYTNAGRSIGFILAQGAVRDVKLTNLGIAIMGVANGGGSLLVDNIAFEVCGCALLIGETTIALYDVYYGTTYGPGLRTSRGVHILNCGFESCGSSDTSDVGAVLKISAAYNIVIENFGGGNIAAGAITDYAIWLFGANQFRIHGVFLTDGGTAGFDLASIGVGTSGGGGNLGIGSIEQAVSLATNLGPAWLLPSASDWSGAANNWGITFRNCNTDGAIPFAALPKGSTPPKVSGIEMACSDSTDPAWTGTVSNVGKPITGGGVHTVKAISRSGQLTAGGSWTTSNDTITMASTIPAWVVAGMTVYDVTTGNAVGTVSSGAGTTILTLTGNATSASSGSSDVLLFYQWVIAG